VAQNKSGLSRLILGVSRSDPIGHAKSVGLV